VARAQAATRDEPPPEATPEAAATGGSAGTATSDGLTDRDRRMLEFEQQWWRYPGAKEDAIRAEFGMSPTRYYQALNALIESPVALAADPVLVRRLLRLRDQRRAARSGRLSHAERPGDAGLGRAEE